MKKIILFSFLIFLAVVLGSLAFLYFPKSKTEPLSSPKEKLTLEIEGEGFTPGDIVQIKKRAPQKGEIIVFDLEKNKSFCLAMGPKMALGEVWGLPQEKVIFQKGSLLIGQKTISLGSEESLKLVLGKRKYSSWPLGTLTLAEGEFLLGQKVGQECFPQEEETAYLRFSVYQEAILGVIEKKIGHDQEAEKRFRERVY